MQRHYETIADTQRGPFTVIVDCSWEDLHPRDCFDDSVTDIQQLCEDIDSGKLEWFMLRVRVLFQDVELASEYLGGCLYADAREVMLDGTAEDIIYQALQQAQAAAADMKKQFAALDENAVDNLYA
jgi:hypothetical protein